MTVPHIAARRDAAWLLASCGSAGVCPRSRRPIGRQPPGRRAAARASLLPAIEKRALSNGLPCLDRRDAQSADGAPVSWPSKAGRRQRSEGKFGLASLTAAMLDEGAGRRNALADRRRRRLSRRGPQRVQQRRRVVRGSARARRAARRRAADHGGRRRCGRPSGHELKRVRDERLTSLLQAQDDPEQFVHSPSRACSTARRVRYGTSTIGTATSVQRFTVADLKAFHDAATGRPTRSWWSPATSRRTSPMPLLEKAFGAWTGSACCGDRLPGRQAATTRRVFLIDKPGAAQSQIRIGGIGVPRSTPDYFALRVLNTMLGGVVHLAAQHNLREQHGLLRTARSRPSTCAWRPARSMPPRACNGQDGRSARRNSSTSSPNPRAVPREELDKATNYLSLLLPHYFETIRQRGDVVVVAA